MNKDSSARVNKAHKIFGGGSSGGSSSGSSLKINGEDASRLVGGIVEKGFSDQPKTNRPMGPSSAPRPTVLPFPVARHRSHGPHWNALSDNHSVAADNDDAGDDEEEEYLSGSNFVSAFANPVQRKEKKGLNFSKWREIVTNGNNSVSYKKEGNKRSVESADPNQRSEVVDASGKLMKHSAAENSIGSEALVSAMEDIGAAVMEVVKEKEPKISDTTIDNKQNNLKYTPPTLSSDRLEVTSQNGIAEMKVDTVTQIKSNLSKLSGNEMEVDTEMLRTCTSNIASGFTPRRYINEGGSTNLESQIDAENRAQLERMSADEIAEAQAELMAKMRPELVQSLKNRGQEKLKKQKASSSDMTVNGEVDNVQNDKNQAKMFALSNSGDANNTIKAEYKDREDDNTVPKPSPKSSSLWDSWAKRVEGVREIRFSIDGTIVETDFAQVPGNASEQNGYSANNVSERDFLRTEGDPGAAGYSIKEAVALCRSVVPGQRALALHLMASILGRALRNIQQNRVDRHLQYAGMDGSTDWEAIWAFALGPEPDLALSLRICLDDNHNSVVLACAKVIQCVLSCDVNESYFDISENTSTVWSDVFTAPIFRSRPEINFGFLHGGFWKYNTKPSNIVPFGEGSAEEGTEGEPTIKDDIVVAGQDIAAGLVRMGILQRILYLLETNPSGGLEEWLITILVAIARHSPASAAAIMNCQRLVQTVVNRFIMIDQTEINPTKIKSVTLLKVLARVEKKNCMEFLESGVLQKMMWHLYRPAFSIDQWVKSGREACKLSLAMLVEQLRFWKVCIQHGYCISDFCDLFPALCIWLNTPELEKLIEKNVLVEYAAIAKEVYLVLESLTRRLPNFYLSKDQREKGTTQETEFWCWSYVGPLIDLALEWTKVKNIPCLMKLLNWKKNVKESSDMQILAVGSLLWLISSVMHMLSGVLEAVIPEENAKLRSNRVPWLPDFVPKIGLAIAKYGFLSFSEVNDTECDGDSSFLKSLCYWRQNGGEEISIASVCCLQGLVQVIISIDKLIQLANPDIRNISSQPHAISRDDKILADGMIQSAHVELEYLLTTFMKLVDSEWQHVQSIEIFGRGGPAPGVGTGWGGSSGGFFSPSVLLAQADARFVGYLFQIFQIVSSKDSFTVKEMTLLLRINSALEACLIAGPSDRVAVEKLLDVIFQVPVLRYLDSVIFQFLNVNMFRPFDWKYEDKEFVQFGAVLASHYKNRWLPVKKKKKTVAENSQASRKASKKGRMSLDTIDEEGDASNLSNQDKKSLVQEWAHQRLPLPRHWVLSPISNVNHSKKMDHSTATNMGNTTEENVASMDVAEAGLFFILAIEAMSAFLTSDVHCFIQYVPVVWKLHSLSVILLDGMAVLEHEKSREVYETLQDVYGKHIDESRRLDKGETNLALNFQSEIHESYSTFIETLVEQFAAVSYGDLVFGRQVAIYLHRCVESPIRLATWKTLSIARALELLPPLEKCIADADGYLEPVEDDEGILEAYAKSWVSDALDRAAARRSAAFTIAVHHLSSFIFEKCKGDRLTLRNKLVKSLLRDCSRKQQHKGMMLNLIEYKSVASSRPKLEEASSPQLHDIEKRLCILKDACEGNSSLKSEVEKLEAFITQ